jgi:hypothetical protein
MSSTCKWVAAGSIALALLTGLAVKAEPFDEPYAALTAAQHSRIAEHVRREGKVSVVAPEGLVAAVGSTVPAELTLHWMHPEPGLSRFRYVVIDGQAFVVEPDRRRILGRIEGTR